MLAIAVHDIVQAIVMHHHAHGYRLPQREQIPVVVALYDRLVKAQIVLRQRVNIIEFAGPPDIGENLFPRGSMSASVILSKMLSSTKHSMVRRNSTTRGRTSTLGFCATRTPLFGSKHQQALLRKLAKCFAHGPAADAKALRQINLAQWVARLQACWKAHLAAGARRSVREAYDRFRRLASDRL